MARPKKKESTPDDGKGVEKQQQDGPLKYKPFEKLQRVGNWKQDTQNS